MANISKIKLPNGTSYDIYDATAVHSAADLGIGAVMMFGGTVATLTDLNALDLEEINPGTVYLVTATNQEYVVVQEGSDVATRKWEPLGNVHDAASSTHIHTVSSSGTANLAVSGTTGSVVKTITPAVSYLSVGKSGSNSATTESATLVKSVSASTATVVTGLTSTSIAIPGFATKTVMTGLGTASTVKVLTGVKANTATVKVVTTDGVAPSWTFTVADGLLTIAGANGSAPVTTATSVATGVASNGTATVIKSYAGATTLVNSLDESDPTTVTVVTGASGTTSAVTGVTTSTQKVTYIKSVTFGADYQLISSATTGADVADVAVVTDVTASTGSVNVTGTATGAISVTGSTSQPVSGS